MVQLLVAGVMLFAGVADAGTIESLRGQHGLLPQILAGLLFVFVLGTAATAVDALIWRRSRAGGRGAS